MASKVILKKQKATDVEGHLAIQHMHFNKKKIVSLQIKMNEEHFVNHFNAFHQRFDRTTIVDYVEINKVIREKIDDLSCFGVVKGETGKEESFLTYFQKNINIHTNPSTINVRNSVLKKLQAFQKKKAYEDISFAMIDYYFIVELKNFIRHSATGTTTKTYMEVVKAVLNLAKRDLLYIEKYDYFEKLEYKIYQKDNSALTKDEVQRLLSFQLENYSYEMNMFLIAIFLHGVRASDLFLMRNENFRKEGIVYMSKKTGKKMAVSYADKLVTLLCATTGVKSANETNTTNVNIERVISDTPNNTDKNQRYGNTQRLIEHIDSLPKKDYFFKNLMDKEPILQNYDKNYEMTNDQHQAYTRLIVAYNYKLKQVLRKFESETQYKISKITSHTSRYTFANLCLEVDKPDINAISRALGHSSLKTTMDYFNKNFGKERVKDLAVQFNSQFDF
ncbi:phage integrase SAM-like domain-containing protein [Flavobacterium sandaracinum]|uniref:Tyr recombinase domain-containing protein n=1 Tax=Flavobacterium sandaracinum TaxID=2541733 RepID=A0A4V6PFE5_9FLAO|nr:tyrosine-type recombinase/integrase [Flavobacterium sandaracinum]TDE01508.1 hypothetical protein E0F91_14230 [Flavobacterium sandaracinum]